MQKILLKKVPKRTNHRKQCRTMQKWASLLALKYSAADDIPVISAKKYVIKKASINNRV